jgi:glycosyltransferase involved in cell wall biosynthesis
MSQMTPIQPLLSIVVPCFNEEQVLPTTAQLLLAVLEDLKMKTKISPESFIYFIDDGSGDATWKIIEELHDSNPAVKGLKLAHNAGHQHALLAGMLSLRGKIDCTISADADLQDDISAIEGMIDEYCKGCDIVYGIRKEREHDTLLKKTSALAFYRLMKLMGIDIVYNHADFRLISRRALETLSEFREVNLFLRGIIPLLGFRTAQIYYNRLERSAGVSKYNLRKMLSLAFDGITSFSVVPLRIISVLGLFFSCLSLSLGVWVFVSYLLGRTVPGWASTVLPIYVIGGIQLLSIGLIGEYLGKIFKEVKARPRYIIEQELF